MVHKIDYERLYVNLLVKHGTEEKPLGRFGSVREAARAHEAAHPLISRYCKSVNHPDYYYCE